MRIADFIINRLNEKYGIKYVSLLTGNGALVLNDALGQNKNITPICCHHEQHCGYVALGMSKYTNKLSVVMTTTGCAATNAITPLLAAYQDHTPILFLSGDINLKQTGRYHRLHNKINAKKIGNQEVDIIEIVKPITKYSVMVEDIRMVQYELDKAIDIALTPPFGPVWINLPADISASLINGIEMYYYNKPLSIDDINQKLDSISWRLKLNNDLQSYSRPLILAGNGVTLSGCREQFRQFVEKYQLPVTCTYGGIDLLDYNHPLFTGVIGLKGCRAGNFAIQNCNILLTLGACLNVPQVGYHWNKFADKAKKWVVDLDVENHKKDFVKIDEIIECELGEFFKYML